ncbi:GNAT family N-acetyltransferase [Thalassobacillus devorans]|uniref:GNAT family N-acetyltransferase n=1 Tax=Thalassobacillus devorans TaxID=279813 RepID=UPI000A1CD7DD|nr:GNAT family N-acetyltransferase [Thalassobacillus devorans]
MRFFYSLGKVNNEYPKRREEKVHLFLETKRLQARAMTQEDAQWLINERNKFFQENHLIKTTEWPGNGLLALLPFYTEALEAKELEAGFGPWYLIEKPIRKVIGNVNLKSADKGEQVEIGYTIVPSARGKGFAQEAVAAVSDWVFTRKVAVITAQCDQSNLPSLRVLKNTGFKIYGREDTILFFKKVRNSR